MVVTPALAIEDLGETTNSEAKTELLEQRRKRKKRYRKKRRRSRRRRSRRRHRRKKTEPALIQAREKVARERLYSGGHEPNRLVIPQAKISILPLLYRFRNFDRDLTTEEISYIYYNYKPIRQTAELEQKANQDLSRAIKIRAFRKALGITKEQLKFRPLDLTLISKASQLAHHVKDKGYLDYTWQLTELLYIISKSGDGLSVEKPYRLHALLDIIRFEEIWLETDPKDILEIKIVPKEKGNLIKLFYKDAESKKQIRYYELKMNN